MVLDQKLSLTCTEERTLMLGAGGEGGGLFAYLFLSCFAFFFSFLLFFVVVIVVFVAVVFFGCLTSTVCSSVFLKPLEEWDEVCSSH